jgi:hypothetical protein
MASATTTTVWNNSSDANFRAWGSWFSNLFVTTFSWVEVYSNFATGTDWTDVTAPAAANSIRVTKIFRMNDASQSTAPLYLLLGFGSGAAAATPGLRVGIGTGTDGSGNLTGILYDSGGTTLLGVGASNANTMTHYASGDSGRAVVAMSASGTSWLNTNSFILTIERRKNGSGASQTTGFLFGVKHGSSMKVNGTTATATNTQQSAFCFPVAATNPALVFDSKVCVAPMLFPLGPSEIGLNVVAVTTAGYPVGTSFTCTVLGSSHTYITLQDSGLSAPVGGTSIAPAILYE